MAYSSIKKKKCKHNGCERYPGIGMSGYCWTHLPEDKKEKIGTKRQLYIKNKNKRNAMSLKLHAEQKKIEGSDKWQLSLWFVGVRQLMTGFCACGCGLKSSKDDDKLYKNSAAHVLRKSIFHSVAYHLDNFIELAFWGGCHTVLDDKGYEYCKETKPILWKVVVEKFKILYPLLTDQEKGKVPQILINEL